MRIRRESRESGKSAVAGEGHLTGNFLPRQESHQKDIAAGELGRGREADDVDLRLRGDRLDRLHLGGEQRADEQLRALGDHLTRGIGGALGSARCIARHEGQPVAPGGEQRQLRRLQHRLA